MSEVLVIANIAQLDADIYVSVHGGDVAAVVDKWVKPLPDQATKERYALYIAERIHEILMSEIP